MNVKNLIISILFIVIGIALISYAFMRPCQVDPVVNNGSTVEYPAQVDRLLCLSVDSVALISMMIGIAAIFPGVSGLFKSLTADSPKGTSTKK